MTAPIKKVPAAKYRLGDIVHAIAHPIAIAIDTVARTRFADCPACAARRAALNRIFDTRPEA